MHGCDRFSWERKLASVVSEEFVCARARKQDVIKFMLTLNSHSMIRIWVATLNLADSFFLPTGPWKQCWGVSASLLCLATTARATRALWSSIHKLCASADEDSHSVARLAVAAVFGSIPVWMTGAKITPVLSLLQCTHGCCAIAVLSRFAAAKFGFLSFWRMSLISSI